MNFDFKRPSFIAKRVPLDSLVNVKAKSGTYSLYGDTYWAVDKDRNVIFNVGRYSGRYGSPMCNKHSEIVESIVKKVMPDEEFTFELIERAFVKFCQSDY